MSQSRPSSFLRRVLVADAVTSGATGLLMLGAASLLESQLAVPASLLRYAGLSLLPFAAFVGWLATRETVSRAAIWTVIVCNVLWTADSLLLLLVGPVEPNALGQAFVIAQAVVVGIFAEAQIVGLRKSPLAAASASA